MTGMKEGAGEDPFAESAPEDDPDAESESPPDTESSAENAHAPTRTDMDRGRNAADDGESRTRTRSTSGESDATTGTHRSDRQQMQIPYKLRRDGVQDGRDRVPLFLHPETKRAERDTLHELENRFDDNVSLTDLREALVMIGMDHVDEVERQLEEWGYGMTFDE